MSWYLCNTPHDRMRRGQVYWLDDTVYTELRVEHGHLEPADEPEWNKLLPEDKRWPLSSETTAPYQ